MNFPLSINLQSRRDLLKTAGGGFGSIALNAMLQQELGAAQIPPNSVTQIAHHPPRAKRGDLLMVPSFRK